MGEQKDDGQKRDDGQHDPQQENDEREHEEPEHEKWSCLSSQVLQRNPYYDFCQDRYQPPRGEVRDYFYISIPGSSMVLPVLESGELVMIRQYRYLMRRLSLEFPAGGVQRGMTPLATAQQELQQEAGLTAGRWEEIGRFAPCNGLSNELCHVFMATELRQTAAAPESTEELEVVHVSMSSLKRMIRTGELWDGMTVASSRYYEAKLEGGANP